VDHASDHIISAGPAPQVHAFFTSPSKICQWRKWGNVEWMAATDRTQALCDLLLAAAFADDHLDDREADRVQELLAYMLDGKVPAELEGQIDSFDNKGFDLEKTAAFFKNDSLDDKTHLLSLVAAVHDADDELDLAEDDFLQALAKALAVPASELGGLTVKVEVEELKTRYKKATTPPPLPPGALKK
jgi:uncharacterized membrane protein YebE (DUF533 family)